MRRSNASSGRIARPVTGDDPGDKRIVMELIDEIGFDAVDDGTIADSWRQQTGTPVYKKDFDADGTRRALAQARNERTAEWQATPNSPGS